MFGSVSLVSKGDRRAPVRYRYVRDVDQPVAVIVVLVLDGHVAEDAMPLQRVEIHGEVLPNVERAIRLKVIAHIERASFPSRHPAHAQFPTRAAPPRQRSDSRP